MQSVPGLSKPRSGWAGHVDRLIGAGATSAELVLQFVPAIVLAITAWLYAKTTSVEFSGWQLGLIAFFAFDFMRVLFIYHDPLLWGYSLWHC